MAGNTISLFMWGYQPHLRVGLQVLARSVLKALGADSEAVALLVGVRRPHSANPNPVCVEPEDGQWPLNLFVGLTDAVEDIYSNHKLKDVFYSDERNNIEKPEMMRRSSVTTAVRRSLVPFDNQHDLLSFCGAAHLIEDFYVVPVIQVPKSLFQKFRPLDDTPPKHEFISNGHRSFIHAALACVLEEASAEMERKEPGRSLMDQSRQPDEIIRIAAERFMYTPGSTILDRFGPSNLFSGLNQISSLLYEGARGVGRLVLANPASRRVEFLMRFSSPIPFGNPRWTRKILQLASPHSALIADSDRVYGLGRIVPSVDSDDQSVFVVDFLDHYTWELSCGDIPLIRCRYGVPTLPNEVVNKNVFISNLARLFGESSAPDRERIWDLFCAAVRQSNGSMIVIAEDAVVEARRLNQQGTVTEPVKLTTELFQQVSSIDGTILLDPKGVCHAIGVILDGAANDECTPARGSRFNSAVRYVRSGDARRFAIVVSDDRTVDVFPALRPILSRTLLESRIAALVAATADNYHEPMNWIDSHRFYLDESQCNQVNEALALLDEAPREVGEIRFLVDQFDVDPEFDPSFLTH